MNTGRNPSDYQAKIDRQWAFEVAFFLQKVGVILRNTGEALSDQDYQEAREQAASLEQSALYEKTLLPDFRTSAYFMESRRLFIHFLDECTNFADLLNLAILKREAGSEDFQRRPVQIRESTERLNLLKDMLTSQLHLYGWC